MRTEPPIRRGLPLLGSLFSFVKDMPGFLVSLHEEHGPVAQFRLGRKRVVSLAEPDLVEQILVRDPHLFLKSQGMRRTKLVLGNGLLLSEGDFHLRQRRLASKAFPKPRIDSYADSMVRISQQQCADWKDGQTVLISGEMMLLTLRVVAKTLFDHDTTEDAAAVERSMTAFQRLFPILLLPATEFLEKLPVPTTLQFRNAARGLDEVVYRIIDERSQSDEDRGDLLSILMAAKDEETGEGMSRQQLRDEVLTIFLAGHETTATAMCWTLYLLALNPKWYQPMLEEIDDVLGGRAATASDFSKLDLTRRVFAESMRLYPPAWTLGRECIHDYPLGDYVYPQGTTFLLSTFVAGRDARHFPSPLVFDPDRFLSQDERPKYAYFPFGGGRRKCLGERFSWMEGVLILATLSQHWRFSYQGAMPARYSASLTLRVDQKLGLKVHAR